MIDCPEQKPGISDLSVRQLLDYNKQLQFEFISYDQFPVQYHIYNLKNQLILQGAVSTTTGLNTKIIDIPDLSTGFYFLAIENEGVQETDKFIYW